MSFCWGRYSQKVLGKWKPFQFNNWKYYPTPGCIQHCEILGEERGRRLFSKYVDLPQAARTLYWKTHPTEYQALLNIVNRKKK